MKTVIGLVGEKGSGKETFAVVFKQLVKGKKVAHALKKRIEKLEADFIIIDGIRWEADVELLRGFPKNYLIYITSDLQTRYERLKQRGDF